ncbi:MULTISPECIES: hypothetical protein [Mycolicibacterium]|jgi:hypothetical protein|uniref:Uncharacterized protein n=3 Tax=Mycolicibacterium TaxID=1866885 RepID=A0A378W484_9MYCO|nr:MULTISPECIES: hypothetical protein [Mycolicibacterium]KLI09688.1 hypothetical protein AA982_03200 [Mycolicibacterium senegalense]KLO51674.1 hypothetical protein ABW05_09190 [Mycolicibacterium senegalense]KMV14443.1 hypothetical protein ACT17_30305 [Mycolicibacterium conceptionense]MCV7337522.1 hypothetical protein [Mycolicibacterium senegalense]MCW1820032.1 hypothetical protein [Mycolicibacterium senegalense]
MSTFFPGYAVPVSTGRTRAVRGTSALKLLAVLVTGIALVAGVLAWISHTTSESPARYMCPPDCGTPPTGRPVAINPVFTAPDQSFSVSYPVSSSAYKVTTNPTGVTAEFQAGDGGMLQLFSEQAGGRSAEDIANSLVEKTFPDTKTAYTIPNAMVGYQPGFGLVADCWPQGATSNYMRMRVLVLVAVKDDLALVASAVGPYREFGPGSGASKPSGANLQLALDMGKYVNSFRWRGDPDR